jgi:hypothetical protein
MQYLELREPVIAPGAVLDAETTPFRPLYRLVEVPVGDDGKGRPELLLVDNTGAVDRVRQDGGLVEVAGAVDGLAPVTARAPPAKASLATSTQDYLRSARSESATRAGMAPVPTQALAGRTLFWTRDQRDVAPGIEPS